MDRLPPSPEPARARVENPVFDGSTHPTSTTLAPHVRAPIEMGKEPGGVVKAKLVRRPLTPLDATLQTRALELIKASLHAHHALLDDPEVVLAIAEGETSLLEALDCLLEADLNDEALLEGLRALKETVLVRTHRLEERRKSRRVIIEQALLALERRVLERPCATVSLNDRTAGVQVDDESIIPTRFFAMKPVLDRRALKAALEAGEVVPGARLGAGLLTLTVRRR